MDPDRSNTNTTSRGKHTTSSGPGGITLTAKVPSASPDSGAGGSIWTTDVMLSRHTLYCTSRSFEGHACVQDSSGSRGRGATGHRELGRAMRM
jgi:hypothetical protein